MSESEIPESTSFHGKYGVYVTPGVRRHNCDVWDCTEDARFRNPASGMRYCQKHAAQLGYRIVSDNRAGTAVAMEKVTNARRRNAQAAK